LSAPIAYPSEPPSPAMMVNVESPMAWSSEKKELLKWYCHKLVGRIKKVHLKDCRTISSCFVLVINEKMMKMFRLQSSTSIIFEKGTGTRNNKYKVKQKYVLLSQEIKKTEANTNMY
jgi:hypothetical protein